ncbi:MAG: hypothetical protein JWN44_3485 [Myxococcales bacterium]|nr:hypothetical protein [Myxococcales bacterium]
MSDRRKGSGLEIESTITNSEPFAPAGPRRDDIAVGSVVAELIRILVRAGRMDDAVVAATRENELLRQTGAAQTSVVGSQALVKAAQGDVAGALGNLRVAIADNDPKGDVDAALDQRQLVAELLVRHGPRDAARRAIATLQREAAAHGYGQATRDAAALERQLN